MKIDYSDKLLEELMKIVIEEVDVAINEGNSPFAAILVDKFGNIVAKTHNTTKSMCNPILHAEINLINKVCEKLHTMDLSEYCIVSNAWSCSMCMSACIKAKITNFVFGTASESNMNPNVTIYDIEEKTNNKLNITIDILEEECKAQILKARNNN